MPYNSISELPKQVQSLPDRAKRIWMRAYNNAYEQYDSEEERVRVAWSAVREEYEQDEEGNWVRKIEDRPFEVVKSNEPERYTFGVVYPANEVDKGGDFTTEEEIKKTSRDFMASLQGDSELTKASLQILDEIVKAFREDKKLKIDVTDLIEKYESVEKSLGLMHSYWDESLGTVVDNIVLPDDWNVNGNQLKKGDWCMGVVWAEDVFKEVQEGNLTGYSIGGRAERVEV